MMRLVRLALTLPPHVVARRALGMIRNRAQAAVLCRLDRRRSTRTTEAPGPLQPLLPALPSGLVEPHRGWVLAAAERFREARFDHLGSGWVRVVHGMRAAGVGGHRYAPAAARPLPAPARAESDRLRAMISPAHTAIDWHVDFKSGHRWAEDCWYKDIAIGHLPGVDVKVPWELGRLHHLTILAWAEALEPGQGWAAVFRDHVLDFLAANPPRFGVNWRCTMDVGIRAANLVVGWELMRVAGAGFDEAFTEAVARSLVDHGRHIMANLEKYPEGRGNHYLANICGLAFVARALPPNAETRAWLDFVRAELPAELNDQFLADGANFEASTCYHRLSAEMAAMAVAVLAGGDPAFPAPAVGARLAAMAEFTRGVTKPSGRVAQIGDNDSGRFLKLQPAYDAELAEDDLDHRHLLGGIGALLGRADLVEAAGPFTLDGWVAAGLAGRVLPTGPEAPARPWPRLETPPEGGRRIVISPSGGGSLRDGLEGLAWPDFGYWLLRSPRLWLGVRCGAIGQNGRGGHAHNDQLAVELCIDGIDWIADPGTWLYTPLPEERNRYRSAQAHFVPRPGAGCFEAESLRDSSEKLNPSPINKLEGDSDNRSARGRVDLLSSRSRAGCFEAESLRDSSEKLNPPLINTLERGAEPGRLDLGLFWLGDQAQARCLHFGMDGFVGEHRGYGFPVTRRVMVEDERVVVIDGGFGGEMETVAVASPVDARRLLIPEMPPFSPGYGKRVEVS